MRIRPEKIQACTGFEPMTSELTSQLGAGHEVGSKTREVMNKWLRIYETHIFELRTDFHIFLTIYSSLHGFI